MMEKLTEAVVNQMDENNMKAQQILKAVLMLMGEQNEDIDYETLIESALHFVEANDSIFNEIK